MNDEASDDDPTELTARFLTAFALSVVGPTLSYNSVYPLVKEMLTYSADEETAEFYGQLIAATARATSTRDVH